MNNGGLTMKNVVLIKKTTNEYRMWDDVGIEDGMLSLLSGRLW